ncbi:GGDEF domain-containing protein [Pantoea vagans]|uniref:GGDEF domain-containing protein n=1 Tax=Pantoea vagans TaxID=470934 RepID=UPI0023AFE0A6|nr:GGDEF domain-containing protein [Pantoea vagans]MDE8557303.1 GGDEF domain-containing protein [Pantoea vagans]MDE8577717.1 GGDEF domain-containing protein [Pantoea vagans]
MRLNFQDKLFHEADAPSGLLYKMIIIYSLTTLGIIIIATSLKTTRPNLDYYFINNIITVLLLTWFIRRSFNILSSEVNLRTFRVSLFLLLNSTLASLIGGLDLIDAKITELISSTLYIPAIALIIFSFNKFIIFVNDKYKTAIDQSLTDELTGLPNRRHMNLMLRNIEDLHATICILDIDDFKKINDTYGHEMGDKVLRRIGVILKSLSNKKTFISRSGGEEFAIIITGEESPGGLIDKIKHAVSMSSTQGIPVTISVGVAEKRPYHTSSFTLTAADSALYFSKKNGKNIITYSSMPDEI